MLPPDPPARLSQVRTEALTEEMTLFLSKWTGGIFQDADSNPVLLTIAHNPKLADAFSQFNIHLLSANSLPVRQRQIAILRTAWICRATYMWSSHLRTSLRCGIEPEVFGAIPLGAGSDYFSGFERAIIHATDELVNERQVSDASWACLRTVWSDEQMLDFLFTVGAYAMIAGVMRSTGVERKQELRDLAEQYGAP